MARIAMVSTVYKRTPPVGYGGIERVVHALTEELIRRGHEVTLLATPGSHCSGTTVEIPDYHPQLASSGVNSAADLLSEEALYQVMCQHISCKRFDLVHDFSFENLFVRRHPEQLPFVISTCIPLLPGTLRQNLVACSAAHARQIGGSTRFVRYGLNLEEWPYRFDKDRHFVHIAKIARYKGQHEAVVAAALAGRKLQVIGNVEQQRYYDFVVRPLIAILPGVSYLGEALSTSQHLLPAAALIQSPKWFDAFPLIVLEALASGTPVISYGEGGVFEQIKHGLTGFICNGIFELAEMMKRVGELDPQACRRYAEDHFAVGRMAEDYEALYGAVMTGERW